MSAAIYVQHYQQFFDNDGNPLAGGKLYTYDAGTNIPRPTYTNPSASVQHPNPIILDAAGKPETGAIFIQGSYRFELYDADGAPVSGATIDNISQYITAKDIETSLLAGFRYIGQQVVSTDIASFKWSDCPDGTVAIKVTCVGGGGSGGYGGTGLPTDSTKLVGGNTSFGNLVIGGGGKPGESTGQITPNNGFGGEGGGGTGDLVIKGGGGSGALRGSTAAALCGQGGGTFLGGPSESAGTASGYFGGGHGSGGSGVAIVVGPDTYTSAGGGGGGTAISFIKKSDYPGLDVAITIGKGGNELNGSAGYIAGAGGTIGVCVLEFYGAGAIQYTNQGPSAPAFGGGPIAWDKTDGVSPVSEYINGIKVEKFNQYDSQEIYAIVTIPDFHEAGNPITLKGGKFASVVDTGNVFFRAQSWLLRGNLTDLNSLGVPYDSTNIEATVPASIGELEDIGDIDITDSGGVLQSQQVQGGDRILVKLYRDVANETLSADGDAQLVINSFELNLGF